MIHIKSCAAIKNFSRPFATIFHQLLSQLQGIETGSRAQSYVVVGVAATNALSISVTAPLSAHNDPLLLAAAPTAMDVYVSTFSCSSVAPAIVAEDPTWKYTLPACAPLIKTTLEPTAVEKVVAIWKTHCPVGFEAPSSVSVDDMEAADAGKVKTPGARIMPPRSTEGSAMVGTRPLALLYAVRHEASAF